MATLASCEFGPLTSRATQIADPDDSPERLIQEHELPEVYRMEHKKTIIQDELADGARRSRNTVTYDDGMSEEQWLQVSSRPSFFANLPR